MNLNRIIKPKKEDTDSYNICSRGKVDTGTRCNYKCYFCYYKDKLNDDFKDSEEIKNEIYNMYKNGIKEFDLSGGESSIHPDFLDIIIYANQFGKVTTLSNGSMFYDFDFLKQSYISGLRGILFSLHGYNKESHNKAVGTDGFDKIFQSILNVKKLKKYYDFELRINTTIVDDINPEKYVKLINDLKPDQVNILPLNYWDAAYKNKKIDYNKISIKIKQIIDGLDKDIEINVRYIPFCFMVGYEQYIVGVYQHIFDKKDWNIVAYEKKDFIITKSYMFDKAFENRQNLYYKPNNCNNCRYLYICDGIESKLEPIVYPVEGDKIKDILYYRNNNEKN